MKRCQICSKSFIKTREQRRRRSGVFIVNFEYISHLFLLSLFNNFEQVTITWDRIMHGIVYP